MNDDANQDDNPSKTRPSSVEFQFVKSPFFRVIHVDGIFGGITVRNNIHIGVFNERNPIPDSLIHEITPEGRIGNEISREPAPSDRIIRELEADIIISRDTAVAIRNWLDDKIKELERVEELLSNRDPDVSDNNGE